MSKYPLHYKVIFVFIFLVILTWSLPFIVKSVMDSRDRQYNRFNQKEGKIIEGMDALGGIKQIIEDIEFVFKAIPNLFKGIGNHVKCAEKELDDGYTSGLAVLGVLLNCSGQSITNFFNGKCTIYYILDIIFGTIYLIFIEFPLALLNAIIGLDLWFIIDLIYDIAMLPIDGLIYGISGYHIIKWPDSVIDRCYKCTGQIGGKTITQEYSKWAKMFNCTNAEINHASKKIFYSIFPVDGHWNTWARGNHLDGADDAI